MKILLAEDHDHLREILEDYLVENDYEVKSFDNGEDAYYCFLTESFDLILLDVMMPKMDGFTLCQKVREKEETPILFITAKVQEVDQLKGYELGCDDYIIKPFSLPVLLAKCKAITNRKHYQFLEKGILKLNTREKQAYLNNQNLNLKIIDYKILEYFIKNVGAHFIFPMHCWEQYDIIEKYKKDVDRKFLTGQIMNITAPGQQFVLD